MGREARGRRKSGSRGGAPAPLTPADCDLRDLPSIMIQRTLFGSDLTALSTGEEFKATLLLYNAAYDQIPAGSLPNDDRLLAFLSRAGSNWEAVKPMALRGWILCDDGRLYHPITAEKVLVAWIGRLKLRLASGAGNESRWNVSFDRRAIEAQIVTAMTHLRNVAPSSPELVKWLRKNPGGIPTDAPPGGGLRVVARDAA